MAAVKFLKSWQTRDRRMEGKLRRQALDALDELELPLTFHKDLVLSSEQNKETVEYSIQLNRLISIFDTATERFILEHLPFARRFSSRNALEGEDPEDVFQVAFIGLQRAVRRFDPKRGDRFVVYCSFWMQQALMKWRADEGSLIRVPAHRHQSLTLLERAVDKLCVSGDGDVSDDQLAAELGWSTDQVKELRDIPRYAEFLEHNELWDGLLFASEHQLDDIETLENVRILADALAEMDSREAQVIKMRFGIGGEEEMTLEEIGKYYDLTRERIRQIEVKALRRLSARTGHLKESFGVSLRGR